MRWSYRIAAVWGIPIKIHISLLVFLAILASAFGLSGELGALATLLLLEAGVLGSIALHELAHSFVALRTGARVREITLTFIGGIAQMENIPRKARDEFLMAAAGPAASVALGLLFWFGGAYLTFLPRPPRPMLFAGASGIRCNIVQYVGVINFFLAAFNLIPAFPMDGGRILRARLSAQVGRLRATFIAATVGRALAVVFALVGMVYGPWTLILVAVFVYFAAGREFAAVEFQERTGPFDFIFRRFGAGRPPRFDIQDEVEIGPPPYRNGTGSRTTIRPADDDREHFWKSVD